MIFKDSLSEYYKPFKEYSKMLKDYIAFESTLEKVEVEIGGVTSYDVVYKKGMFEKQKEIGNQFDREYIKLVDGKKYFYGCPFNIYKATFEKRLKKFIEKFPDGDEFLFLNEELKKGIAEIHYKYLDDETKTRLLYSLDKRLFFIETKANNLGFKLKTYLSHPEETETFKFENVSSSTNEDYKYNFNNVKKYLATLTNFDEKIRYLINRIAEYQQDNESKNTSIGKSFDEKCQIEIDKLKNLRALRTSNNSHYQKVKANQKKSIESFIFNVNDKTKFIEDFKKTFDIEKGIHLKIVIELLKDEKIFKIGSREFKSFKIALENYLQRHIGAYSSLNDDYKHTDANKKYYQTDIENIENKLHPILKKHYKPV